MTTKSRKAGARRKRKPHNVQTEQYESFFELLVKIASEPRKATIGEEEATLTRTEGLLRLMVDRALKGEVREVTQLLQLMAKHPAMATTNRTQKIFFIGKALAGVL